MIIYSSSILIVKYYLSSIDFNSLVLLLRITYSLVEYYSSILNFYLLRVIGVLERLYRGKI